MDYGFAGTGSVTNSGNAPFGKTRYVEAGNRNARGGHAAAARDLHADSQLDVKNEIDGKGQGGKQTRENGDVFQNQVSPQLLATEDRKKLESPLWNEPGTLSFWSSPSVKATILFSGVCHYKFSLDRLKFAIQVFSALTVR